MAVFSSDVPLKQGERWGAAPHPAGEDDPPRPPSITDTALLSFQTRRSSRGNESLPLPGMPAKPARLCASAQGKGWGFPEKQARLFSRKSPAFSLCACAQAGRQSRPARERQVFVSSAAAVHCLKRKTCNIRNGWGPGRIILPGGAWGSAPAFFLLLRHTAWEISLIPSATDGVRGGSSSPAGPGAAPGVSLIVLQIVHNSCIFRQKRVQ